MFSRSDEHFERLARLLTVESHAAAAQAMERLRRLPPREAEQSGLCLLDLAIDDASPGLAGRVILRLVKRRRGEPLPWTRLGIGSPVMISPDEEASRISLRGVVSERTQHALDVAVEQLPDEADDVSHWRVDLSSDEVAERRQRHALATVRSATGNRLAKLRRVLLGEQPAQFDERSVAEVARLREAARQSHSRAGGNPVAAPDGWIPACAGMTTAPKSGDFGDEATHGIDSVLDPTQQAAVQFALSARDVALIHGPPGTGKTTALVELIRQAVRRGERVLACAGSNLAVDNLLERLVARGELVVRLGHPARVLPQLRKRTLDHLVEEHPDVRLSHKLLRESYQLRRKAGRYTRAKPAPGAKQAWREEARALVADARRLERLAINQILDSADVLCATNTGLDAELLGDRRFDLVVIDEACQSTEPGSWIPLLYGERVVLAGDHCQLPPTVISPEAAAEGFAVSLFERLMQPPFPPLSRRLEVQYRMHADIMGFSSREVGSSRVDLQACKLEYSIVSPK